MTEPPATNVITIDGHAIEYRLQRRGGAAVLILHGGHMSACCRFGEEVFLETVTRCWSAPARDMAGRASVPDRRRRSSPYAWQISAAGWSSRRSLLWAYPLVPEQR
jgi:hypothetical protein